MLKDLLQVLQEKCLQPSLTVVPLVPVQVLYLYLTQPSLDQSLSPVRHKSLLPFTFSFVLSLQPQSAAASVLGLQQPKSFSRHYFSLLLKMYFLLEVIRSLFPLVRLVDRPLS